MSQRDVYVVTGQTASGKTSHALSLARQFGGELISADSRQIYQKLDIITGKDIPEGCNFVIVEKDFSFDDARSALIGYYEIEGIKLWGLDLIDIKNTFSSYDFKFVSDHIISTHIPAASTPIIVGGTYLYIKNLIYGFDVAAGPNWDLRKKLESVSVSALQEKLLKLDPHVFESLNNSDRQNPHRLIRKIEIALQGAKTQNVQPLYNVKKMIGLEHSSRESLEEAIEKRIEDRIRQGATQEVKNLLASSYTKDDPGLNTIGYKEIISYLEGELSLEEACELWKRSEVKYAKRQSTFMKGDKNVEWSGVRKK